MLPDTRVANLAVFAVLWSALLGWQVVSTRSHPLPSFFAVVALARRWRTTRCAVLVGWGWLGWHLFVRTRY